MAEWLAHVSEDGTRQQTVLQHLEGTADYARLFAERFHAGSWGEFCGMAHDLGKFTPEFQRRLLEHGQKVDHSTAGAIRAADCGAVPAAFCIAGHHGGLPDGGSSTDPAGEAPTLRSRLKQRELLERCSREAPPAPAKAPPDPGIRLLEGGGYSLSFFTRMLYSCLVDADYLDTERFMRNGQVERGMYDSIPVLHDRLMEHISGWLENRDTETLNGRRSAILRSCTEGASHPQGLFTLTVPTGGGKTVASLAFALRHAQVHGLERVIYVIPYTSILEQNAQVFRDILGDANVLEHHANYDFEADEQKGGRHHLAAENWDAPVVVTTNVQFFESLYAAKPGRCRKLHNISRSVLIFDEAQMLPVPYLKPCVRAIGELTANYGCSAVLCTATQPTLAPYFPAGLSARELCPGHAAMSTAFRRAAIRSAGRLSDAELAEKLAAEPQALCIVNTRKQAQVLFSLLPEEGAYHLSTLLYPKHRRALLAEIRERLEAEHQRCLRARKEGRDPYARPEEVIPCRVVSTSLIEAGVDVDFPTVYRARAGLDSLLQAAGRCNREGRRPAEESVVYLFEPEEAYTSHLPAAQAQPADVLEWLLTECPGIDLASQEAVTAYFEELFALKGDSLDKLNVVAAFEKAARTQSFPFRTIAEQFHLIDNGTRAVLIPQKEEPEACELADTLRRGERNRSLLRRAGQYSVNIYEPHFQALYDAGALERLDDDITILRDLSLYDRATGLQLDPETGKGLFI